MPLTRDPDFPAEIANLMQSFSSCANGHSTLAVLEATANMLIAAIGMHVRAGSGSRDQAIELATRFGSDLPAHVAGQWDRAPQPTDIEVRRG